MSVSSDAGVNLMKSYSNSWHLERLAHIFPSCYFYHILFRTVQTPHFSFAFMSESHCFSLYPNLKGCFETKCGGRVAISQWMGSVCCGSSDPLKQEDTPSMFPWRVSEHWFNATKVAYHSTHWHSIIKIVTGQAVQTSVWQIYLAVDAGECMAAGYISLCPHPLLSIFQLSILTALTQLWGLYKWLG